jgi:hypothetical protein
VDHLLDQMRRAFRQSGRPDLIIAVVAGFIAWTIVQGLKFAFG